MAPIRRYLFGEHLRGAVVAVAATGIAAAVTLAPFGIFRLDVDGRLGIGAFVVVFGLLPGIGGFISARRRFGILAAIGCGIAPGVAFVVVVAVGAALNVGSFGGGDSPLGSFALTLVLPSLVMALIGFLLGIVAAIRGWGS